MFGELGSIRRERIGRREGGLVKCLEAFPGRANDIEPRRLAFLGEKTKRGRGKGGDRRANEKCSRTCNK